MSSKKVIIAACEKGDLPRLQCVLEETELDVGSEPLGSEGETALHVACAHGHLDIVQYLVNDRGCSVAVPNSRAAGATPLEVAWANKHWEVVEFLLKAIQGKELFAEVGLAPTTMTQLQEVAKYGDEALHQACIHGYLEVVRFLTCSDYLYLKNRTGQDPTAVSSHGTTPLQMAWENKHWEVASYLLQVMRICHGQDLGPSPTVITQLLEVVAFGDDAFHVACSRGDLDMVRYLHESLKCSLTQQNAQGETPLDMARLNGHLHVIHFFLESGKCSAPDITELHIACMGRDEEKVRNLASDITSLSIPDQYGITAVHYATYQPENLRILVSIVQQRSVLSLLVRQDRRGSTPLHYAASCGLQKSVQILVLYYKSVNIQNSDGDTPLHLSIRSCYCNSNLVQEILQHESCNPSTVNAQNETALHIASQCGKLDSAELLLLAGKCSQEDIKEAIKDKFLLHQVAATNRLEFGQALLNIQGCKINQLNSEGETPLHVACKGDSKVFELLTADSRCDLNALNKNGLTALHITIASGQLEKYHLLITNVDCNPNIVRSDGNAPLHMMIEKNFSRSLSILLKHPKCNPNMRNNEGNSALHLAVRKRSVACVTCLLQHDRVDPNIQNEIGNTPLHEAVITGTPIKIMEFLIYHKIVNPNMKNNEGNSALHLAVRKRSVACATCLLQHDKVDPNIQNHNGNTPLHDVVTTRAPNEILESFIQHKNCNPQIRNESGKTPLQIASENGLLQYVSIFMLCEKYSKEELRDAASRCRYILHYAVSLNNINLVEMLQNILQGDINEANQDGETPLHIACRQCSIEVVQVLVADKRCDLNVQNNTGDTALHIAAYSESHPALRSVHMNVTYEVYSPLHVAVKVQSAEILLKHPKCNPNFQNIHGHTALHMAIINNTSLTNLQHFINHKDIDLSIQNEEGNTPLHEAVKREVPVDVEALTLHKSCNPSIANNEGMTPLQISVTSHKLDYAEVLIASGKCSHEDIMKTTEGAFLFHQAVASNRPKLIVALLNIQELNMNEINSAGDTPLHVACKIGHSEAIMEKLVEDSRCDLNAQDQHGNTALHLVASSVSKSAEKVQCILQSERCNPNITNSEGYTPLHVAVKEYFKTTMIWVNSEDNIYMTIRSARRRKKKTFQSAAILLKHPKCNPNFQDIHGNTALHMAIVNNTSLTNLQHFINHKDIDLNIQNEEGNTPLHEVVKREVPVDVLEALTLHKSCNPSIANNEGMTPLQISVTSCKLDYAEVLLTNGRCSQEDIIKTTEGTFLLHQAVASNRLKLVVRLMDIQDYNMHRTNPAGETALHIACKMKISNAILEKLVEDSRCDLNAQDQHGNTALHLAANSVSDSAKKVQCISRSDRCNPNISNSDEHTPLHFAVIGKEVQSAQILLQHLKCNPNIQNLRGNTPLHMALTGNISLPNVQPLLNHKDIDLSIQNEEGNTPLHEAVTREVPVDVVEALTLHKSCNPSIANNEGMTPLQISVTSCKLDYAEVLLTNGKCSHEDVMKTTEGTLLLHHAVASNRLKLVVRLMDIQDYNMHRTNPAGETALHVACKMTSSNAILEKLVEDSRCDLNAQDQHGNTALHLAANSVSDSAKKVQCISRSDRCNPNISNSDEHTPLHFAVIGKEVQSAQILLQHLKCNPNIQNLRGNTPLHMALTGNISLPNVQPLLNHKDIDLSIQNEEGNTPLHEAVTREVPVDVVEALTLHKSCNPSIANNEGMTPLQISVTSCKLDYAEVLLTNGKCSHEDVMKTTEGTLLLHHAVASNRLKLVVRLMDIQDYNMHRTNPAGETALHVACKMTSSNAILEKLVEDSRCDLNAQDQHGNNALHLAVYSGTDVAEKVQCILQSERCNPNITNSEGYTPLHVAVLRKEVQSAEMLLKHLKCNPNIQDLRGNTPLHMALTGNISLPNVQPVLNHKDIDLSIQNREGNTPLHEAVRGQGPVDVVEALTLHKGCNPSIANNAGMTPLQISVTCGKLDYTDILITSGKCSHKDIVKVTEDELLLHQAVSSNRPKLIVALLSIQELNMNGTNSAGETPLHVACKMRCSEAVLEKLVEESRCDLNAQDQHGNTALHLALQSASESAEKVQCILQSKRCNPNITKSEGFQSAAILLKHPKCNPNFQNIHGNTALHMAIFNNTSLLSLQHFLNHKDIDLNIQNREGNTPLHVAVIRQVPVNVVTALVLHSSCNPSIANAEGTTPLQIAVDSQQMETAKAIITSRKCSCEDIERANKDAFFLFDAISSDNVELLTALIDAGVDISKSNSKGETALHAACKEGNIKATELLLQGGADVLAVDCEGNAPIHVACANVNLECLSLILDHKRCNPNQQNAVGDTPLHIVCSYWNCDIRMSRTLLSTPGINPECANHAGQIPAELAKSDYDVIGEISNYLKHKNTKLETYLKIFVVGNSGGGKSTLIKAVTTERSKSFNNFFKAKNVNPSEVPPHTAGIVPLSFNSKHFGHAVLYDFAGQHEYYSSHAAVMENLVLPSPPLFLLLIDISKPMEEIREELVYWWMFINNHSKRATAPPHVILVGSHKDTVKDRGGNVQKIMEEITDIVRDIPVSFQFDHSRAFPLDCRKLVSQGLTALLAQLKLTCETLRQTADIDLHCHILKAFLTTNFHSSIACKVSEIAEKTNPEDDLLPQVPSQLIPLLSTLSDKGYILLLQNHTDMSKSWVVLQPEVLLTEVNGSIFAPDNFKEHCRGFAMSTGVVPLSKIREKFGEPNNQVIIGYLTHLEFCFRIKDKHTLEMITKDAKMQLTTHSSEHAEEYYFFPALIWKENPSDVCQPQETIKYECGWFYRCNEPTEQLTTRFLHVLILRLAFSCDPPDEPTERESVVLLRSCSVWKHGIAWWTNDGIETIVEVGLQCRWVAVMLRCPDTHKVQCAELRTKVISTVLKTKQDFCPAIGMKQFLISPSSLQYPFEGRALTLYSMREITKVVIAGKEFPIDTKGKNAIHISQLLPFEPFSNFGEDLIGNLFTSDEPRERNMLRLNLFQIASKCFDRLDDFKKALQPHPVAFQRECVKPDCTEVDRCVALFQIIQRRGCKTWRDFEQEFSRFSIFCGRDPRVSQILML